MVPKVKKPKYNETSVHDEIGNNCEETDETRRQCNNETIDPREFESEKSERNRNSLGNIRPCTSGSTRYVVNNRKRKTVKFYRRKLKHCETLIKILIKAKSADSLKKFIQKSLGFLEGNDEEKSGEGRSVQEADDAEKNPPRPSDVIVKNSRSEDTEVKKLLKFSRPGTKISEKKSIPSTSKRSDIIDDESMDRVMILDRKCDNGQTVKNQNPSNSIDETSKGKNRIVSKNDPAEIRIDGRPDICEFVDHDVIEDSSVPGPSKEESQSLGSTEIRKTSFVRNKGIRWPKSLPKNNEKSNSNMKNTADRSKGRELSSEINRSELTASNKKKEKSVKPSMDLSKKSHPDETDDLNQWKSNAKKSTPPTGGIHCSCKTDKLKGLKTSSYKIPASIEWPSLKFRAGYGNRSTESKYGQDVLKIEEPSPVCEKKTKKFYSPLELEYSNTLRSKWDNPKNVVKKSKEIFKPMVNQFSTSNFGVCENRQKNSDDSAESSKNKSKTLGSLKFATFSKYSIPVSIEINMVPDKMQVPKLTGNLIQSKITNYYPWKVQGDHSHPKKVAAPNSNLELVGDRNNYDENGNNTERTSAVSNRPESKTRSLPVIQSDVLLQNEGEVIYLGNYPLQKPKLSISRQEYLYGVLKYPVEQVKTTNASGNQNIIFCDNITLSNTNNNCNVLAKNQSDHCPNFNVIDDSNGSGGSSIIPPSYSIFSGDENDDTTGTKYKYVCNDDASVFEVDMSILDSQQREDLLAPWDKVDNLEKVNLWNIANTF